jgi:transposase InsO family protein
MSTKSNPYENAYVESFFKTLKQEEMYLWQYETYDDVTERVPNFIEDMYNRKRPYPLWLIGLQRNMRVYDLKMPLVKVR